MKNIYSIETNDYQVVRGDTINLGFKVYEKATRTPVNILLWGATFTLRDPITNQIIVALQKTHDDSVVNGDGIYYENDAERLQALGFTLGATNELIVVIPYTESATLEPGIYPFDVELTIVGTYTSKFTPIRGNLVVVREQTPSV